MLLNLDLTGSVCCLCPPLVANKIAEERNLNLLALVSLPAPVEANSPQDQTGDAKQEGCYSADDPGDDAPDQRLDVMGADEGAVLLIFKQENDDWNNRSKDIGQECLQLIVVGYSVRYIHIFYVNIVCHFTSLRRVYDV